MSPSLHLATAAGSLSLVLSICSACASHADSANRQRADDLDGAGGVGTPDRAGDASAGDASGSDVHVESAMRSGTEEIVQLRSAKGIFNVWASYCGHAPKLLKPSGTSWVRLQDDRPMVGSHQSYYLDGKLVTDSSLGCDGGDSCYEWTGPMTLSTLEYVQVGTRPAPGNSPDATDSGITIDVPDIVSHDTTAPYELELSYMSGGCSFKEMLVVRLPLP